MKPPQDCKVCPGRAPSLPPSLRYEQAEWLAEGKGARSSAPLKSGPEACRDGAKGDCLLHT